MDIETLRRFKSEYDESQHVYELAKFELESKRLTLKYSTEFERFKTIKEKEERAKLATMELEQSLIQTRHIRNQQKSLYELAELEYLNEDLFDYVCDGEEDHYCKCIKEVTFDPEEE